jgi:hypothetical protein
MKIKLVPIPITNPTVTKNPPIFVIVQPLKISPNPKMIIPTIMTDFDPYLLIIFELIMAKNEIHAAVSPPAKESVDELARPS